MNYDEILRIIMIIGPFLAAIPGIYAIRRQLIMEKVEKRKLIIEAESISADVAAKLIDSAGDLQDFYTELMEEIKKQSKECKDLVYRLECKIDILTEENAELKEELKELKEGVQILSEQVKELGQEPRYPKNKE